MLQASQQASRQARVAIAWAPLLFDAAQMARATLLFVGLVGCAVVVLRALAGGP